MNCQRKLREYGEGTWRWGVLHDVAKCDMQTEINDMVGINLAIGLAGCKVLASANTFVWFIL